MIVISGALVLVAAVLLVLGIVSSITLVYAAIGLSIVSAVFLLVGVFQRPAPPAEPSEADSDSTKRQAPARQPKAEKRAEKEQAKKEEPAHDEAEDEAHDEAHDKAHDEAHEKAEESESAEDYSDTADFPLEAANADFEEKAGATGADVLVISGRPRYHVGGCEEVDGRDDSEPLDIIEARELGFTPCGKCRPNETLARGAGSHDDGDHDDHAQKPAAEAHPAQTADGAAVNHTSDHDHDADHADHTDEQPAAEPSAPATTTPEPEPEPARMAATAAVPTAAMPVTDAPPPSSNGPRPSRQATNATPPATAAPVSTAAENAAPPQAPAPPATAMPISDAAPAPPAEQQSASETAPTAEQPAVEAPPPARRPRRAGRTVFAVAATKEYHGADCDLLEGADSEEITKIAAIRQGYLACGVCKP